MKRLLLGIFFFAGPSILPATVFFDNTEGDYLMDDGISITDRLADDFTLGSQNIIVSQITLVLGGETTSAVEAYIYGNDSEFNLPDSSNMIGSLGTTNGFAVRWMDEEKIFTPESTMILNANTKYWILAIPTPSSTTCGWSVNFNASPVVGTCDENLYARSSNNGASWTEAPTENHQHRMKVEGTVTTLPVELDYFMVE
jgi:hypothetical protein